MEVEKISSSTEKKALSEYESKKLLSTYGIPVSKEILAGSSQELHNAVRVIGFPLVLKGCSNLFSHKTEMNLVSLNIKTTQEAEREFERIWEVMAGKGEGVLVQEMVQGKRELMAGLTRDAQFGPCVMFGIGGIFTEALEDVCFRMAPIDKKQAKEMFGDIRGNKLLGPVRGMEPVDLDSLADILVALGKLGAERNDIQEIDLNPIIIRRGKPVAVDALVIID
ncbi:MAG: acetate--CoA ligase family protein [Syntrophaceae bacterium]|nr:acetate--CoA ligase family protein [Syntrophaceae bacterium]